jgi:hypothetical protein
MGSKGRAEACQPRVAHAHASLCVRGAACARVPGARKRQEAPGWERMAQRMLVARCSPCTSPTQSWLPATNHQGTCSPGALYTSSNVAATRAVVTGFGSGAATRTREVLGTRGAATACTPRCSKLPPRRCGRTWQAVHVEVVARGQHKGRRAAWLRCERGHGGSDCDLARRGVRAGLLAAPVRRGEQHKRAQRVGIGRRGAAAEVQRRTRAEQRQQRRWRDRSAEACAAHASAAARVRRTQRAACAVRASIACVPPQRCHPRLLASRARRGGGESKRARGQAGVKPKGLHSWRREKRSVGVLAQQQRLCVTGSAAAVLARET